MVTKAVSGASTTFSNMFFGAVRGVIAREGDLLEGGEVLAREGEHPNNGVLGGHASVSHLPCCSRWAGCRPGVRGSNPGQGDRFTPQGSRTGRTCSSC